MCPNWPGFVQTRGFMRGAVIRPSACQILGPKPDLPPSTPDEDDRVDTSNKKKSSLYMVRNPKHGGKECRFSLSKPSCHVTCSPSVPDL